MHKRKWKISRIFLIFISLSAFPTLLCAQDVANTGSDYSFNLGEPIISEYSFNLGKPIISDARDGELDTSTELEIKGIKRPNHRMAIRHKINIVKVRLEVDDSSMMIYSQMSGIPDPVGNRQEFE